MNDIMKQRYRIYRRQGSVLYLFDRHTGNRESLETDDGAAALRLRPTSFASASWVIFFPSLNARTRPPTPL